MTTPEPGGTPGTPVTEAGRALLNGGPHWTALVLHDAILAIEAEAARSERERIVAAVEGLPQHAPCVSMDTGVTLDRAAVLALLRDE